LFDFLYFKGGFSMLNSLRYLSQCRSDRRTSLPVIVFVAVIAAVFMLTGSLFAQQQAPLHFNPMVAKLAAGQSVIGTQTADFSMAGCRSLARLDLDFVSLDMEHGVYDGKDMAQCAAFMVDKARLAREVTRR
jgi:hypothetical protein